MPRECKARSSTHQPSAKLSKHHFSVQEEVVDVSAADRAEVSAHNAFESSSAVPVTMSKKGKQHLKHEAFIDRIKTFSTPYSKAQKRRFNRKQREQLGGGLDSIKAAIPALAEKGISPPTEARSSTAASQQRPSADARVGLIGEGKGVPLTKTQRKRVLDMEKLRHPLILQNSQYTTNPFLTIRTHAQNTLEKHTSPV